MDFLQKKENEERNKYQSQPMQTEALDIVEERWAEFGQTVEELNQSKFRQSVKTMKGSERKDDSNLMSGIKSSLNQIYELLSDTQKSITSKLSRTIEEQIVSGYRNVIILSEKYIASRNPYTSAGKARLAAVKRILQVCKEESVSIRSAIQDAYRAASDQNRSDNPETPKVTFHDILKYCRRREIVVDESQKEGGGNNSTVLSINEHQIFKKAEDIDTDYYSVVTAMREERIEALKSAQKDAEDNGSSTSPRQKKMNLIQAEIMKSFVDEFLDALDTVLEGAGVADEKKRNLGWSLVQLLLSPKIRGLDYMETALESILSNAGIKGKEHKKAMNTVYSIYRSYCFGEELLPVDKKLKVTSNTRMQIFEDALKTGCFKRLNGIVIAKGNGIFQGADVTARNVATCRMSTEVLGFDEKLITKTENAVVQLDGKRVDGVVMERAKGISLSDVLGQVGNKPFALQPRFITPKAAKQLLQLITLDMICGQLDRHAGNVFVDFEKTKKGWYIKGFTGIDNDMAFGKLKADTLSNGQNRMPGLFSTGDNNVKELLFKQMDGELYETIQEIDEDFVKFRIADLGLDKDETASLMERIQIMKAELKAKKDDKKLIIKDSLEGISNINDIFRVINKKSVFDGRRRVMQPQQTILFYLNYYKFSEIREIK